MKSNCIFCDIANKVSLGYIIFEDELSIAFLDTKPLFPGHTLLVPKIHYSTINNLPPEMVNSLFTTTQKLAKVVEIGMKAEGSFIAMNNVVSQSIPHFHIHIVPRTKGDGLKGFFWPRKKYDNPQHLQAVQANLVKTWNDCNF